MEKIMVLDTETANFIDEPLCYDIGYIVTDASGEIFAKASYAVAEIFFDSELMTSAYYAEKIPGYWEEIERGDRQIRRITTIKREIAKVCAEYGITKVYAHNARFDNMSLNTTLRYVLASRNRYFLPYGVEFYDTLKMARNLLKKTDEYKVFCKSNGFVCKNGTPRFTAEVLYRFLSNDLEFTEVHKGLDDVMIEKEIYRYCIERDPDFLGKLWED